MKLLSGITTLLLAIIISCVAAYFSVIGLAALFAGAAIPVIIMGTSLEAGKLVAAQWLKSNWANPKVNFLHKTYLLMAIVVLMLITSLGIYGFLSKGHLEQEAPVAGVELQIAQRQQQVTMLETQNKRLYDQMSQLDAGINSFLKGDKAERANAVRNKQKSERKEIDKQIADNNAKIQALNDEILPLKVQTSEVEAKLGPVKYVAELFGWKETGTAVRFVIMLLMFAFDPLALVLLLSATITFTDYFDERKRAGVLVPPAPIPEPVQQPDEVVEEPVIVEEQVPEVTETTGEVEPQEVEFINDVITSGNVSPEAEQEVAPIVSEAKKPRKPRKPRKQKDQAVAINMDVPNVDADEQYRRTLESFVKTAYQGEAITPDTPKPSAGKQLVEILETRPELLKEVIDVISEATDNSKVKVPESEKLQEPESKQAILNTDVPQDKIQQNLRGGWLGDRSTNQ